MIEDPTPLRDWILILPVVLPLLGAAVLLMLRNRVRVQFWVCLGVVATVLACDGALFQRALEGGPFAMTMGNWLPPFGISLVADTTGAGFALAAAFVVFSIMLYVQMDLPGTAVRDGFYPLTLLLLAGVSGAFLTGDLFNLYVWFEVMLIASFGLMSLAGKPLQLDGAVKYGVLNFFATALFLAALGLLYGLLGTLNMADIIGVAAGADLAPLSAITALFTLAFAMKAAVFPVNAWLPASYHAPPPAVSALVGGLLTKVGVYALLRLLVMLLPGPLEAFGQVVLAVAIATAVLGPLSAIAETNLRRAVGFFLIGGVGVTLLAVPGDGEALAGAVAYVVHSMLTVTALYLVAGLIEGATGSADTRNMGGLYAASSMLSVLFFVLMLGAAGVPPFLGFWPKLLLLRGFLAGSDWIAALALLLNALLTIIAGARLWSHIFWRGAAEPRRLPAAGPAATILLTGTIVILALWPDLLIRASEVAAADLLNPERYIAAVGLAP